MKKKKKRQPELVEGTLVSVVDHLYCTRRNRKLCKWNHETQHLLEKINEIKIVCAYIDFSNDIHGSRMCKESVGKRDTYRIVNILEEQWGIYSLLFYIYK